MKRRARAVHQHEQHPSPSISTLFRQPEDHKTPFISLTPQQNPDAWLCRYPQGRRRRPPRGGAQAVQQQQSNKLSPSLRVFGAHNFEARLGAAGVHRGEGADRGAQAVYQHEHNVSYVPFVDGALRLKHPLWLQVSTGEKKRIGEPRLYTSMSSSPDAQYLLVAWLERPFSYNVPCGRFPKRVQVWDRLGPCCYCESFPTSPVRQGNLLLL